MKRLTKSQKILLWILVPVLIIGLIFGSVVLGIYINHDKKSKGNSFDALIGAAQKTVLFIGDGMGFDHIKTTSAYYEKDMFIDSFSIKGEVTTFSNSLLTPTDSAAAGSALSTGKKFNNGEVARHNGENVENMGEYAKKLGLGVGIVTTDSLTGATPASFSAHANNRGDDEDIMATQSTSNIDLFLGAGASKYNSNSAIFEQQGYSIVNNFSSLNINTDKLIGTFSSVVADNGTDTEPTLDMLASFAIEYMEFNYPNGYFLMIEGAHIDKMSHKNNVVQMTKYLNNFDKAIKDTYEKFESINNTAIIVTADHETGGLNYNNENKNEISNSMYTRSSHSSRNVPYFIYINSTKPIDTKNVFPNIIDNTDIARITRALVSKL